MPTIITQGAMSAEGFGFSAPTTTVAPVYIEDVFNTYLYTGAGGTQTITTGLDLSTKGGLVWIKNRTNSQSGHAWTDTARGAGTSDTNTGSNILASNSTNGTGGNLPASGNDYLSAFTTTGFTVIAGAGGNAATRITNRASDNYAAWSFEKQAKFFDIVTYTGNGVANRTVSHNLGSVPGCIIIKRTDTTGAWTVYHTALANTEYLVLNSTAAKVTGATTYWNSTTPTSTAFTLGTATDVNANGGTYVAYLFAHNAGGFGATGTDNVISCGSYVGTGVSGNAVTLGYEPQFVIFKAADGATGNWFVLDSMRQFGVAESNYFWANTLAADTNANPTGISPTATGFSLPTTSISYNQSGVTYVYIAIRRGPMKTPTSGTSVFSPIAANAAAGTAQTTNFVIDSQWKAERVSDALNTSVDDRLRGASSTSTAQGRYLITSATAAEATTNATTQFWNNTGFQIPTYYASVSSIFWNFGRAPGFFDVVCYSGNGTAGATQAHNLGVAPELMFVKTRAGSTTNPFQIYAAPLGATQYLALNSTNGASTNNNRWNDTAPTSTVFTLGNGGDVNNATRTYVAYLFATLAGVSKVGSYTGTGSSQTINCGFSSGARFILIKRTDTTGDWYVYDSARGINAAGVNDPYILWNTTAAEVTSTDYIASNSSGFTVSSATQVNASGGTYVFLAIA